MRPAAIWAAGNKTARPVATNDITEPYRCIAVLRNGWKSSRHASFQHQVNWKAGMSDNFIWGSIAGLVGAFGTVGTWVWYLATKLAVTHAKAHAAEILAAGASGKTSTLERELADHKEHVAAEYVNRDALKEVTAAINRLGDRLDNLFTKLITKQ